jgi:hypothetical protein
MVGRQFALPSRESIPTRSPTSSFGVMTFGTFGRHLRCATLGDHGLLCPPTPLRSGDRGLPQGEGALLKVCGPDICLDGAVGRLFCLGGGGRVAAVARVAARRGVAHFLVAGGTRPDWFVLFDSGLGKTIGNYECRIGTHQLSCSSRKLRRRATIFSQQLPMLPIWPTLCSLIAHSR